MTDSLDIPGIKRLIWREVGGTWVDNKPVNGNNYTLTIAKHATGYEEPATLYNLEKLLKEIRSMKSIKHTGEPLKRQAVYKPTRPAFEPIPEYSQPQQTDIPLEQIKARYNEAHRLNFAREYPAAFKDGHYTAPVYPKTATSNGLTTFIINYILWLGYRATRINVTGRLIDKVETQQSGAKITVKKMIKSSTRKGSADVSSTIQGRSVMWEVKVGRDIPSPQQLREQARERKAGGEYWFVHNPSEFLGLLDQMLHG